MNGYPAIFKYEDGRIVVEFPDFPEAHTFADDEDEAIERARDALATVIDAYIQDREALPTPTVATRGMYYIRLPALTRAKVELYEAMQEEGVSKTDLARRLGWHLPQVNRLLDVTHLSRLDQLERAFGALGRELYIDTVMAHRSAHELRRSGGRKGGMGASAKMPTRAQQRAALAATRKSGRRRVKRS